MQAERIHEWKPWQQSTGPITEAGKAISAQNARQISGNFATLESAMNHLLKIQSSQLIEISEIFSEKTAETNYQSIQNE